MTTGYPDTPREIVLVALISVAPTTIIAISTLVIVGTSPRFVAVSRRVPDKEHMRAPSIGRDDTRQDIRPFGIGGGDYFPAFRHIMPVVVIRRRIPAY